MSTEESEKKSSKTICVIDDEVETTELAKIVLELEGYNVIIANDGKEGIELVKKELPDLIILDISMPGVNGLEVAQQIRNDPETKDIPILMLTARVYAWDREEGLKAGANEYLTKPISGNELLKIVRRYIGD